jgi:hypothetical protein
MWSRRQKKHRRRSGRSEEDEAIDKDLLAAAAATVSTLGMDKDRTGPSRVRTLVKCMAMAAKSRSSPNSIGYDDVRNRLVWTEHRYVKYMNLTDGVIHLLAGQEQWSGDDNDPVDGIGSVVRFGYLGGLVIAENGDIIVADPDNGLVRRITLTGEVTTVAGRRPSTRYSVATWGLSEEERAKHIIPSSGAVEAEFARPVDLALDSKGNILVRRCSNYLCHVEDAHRLN